MCSPPSRDHLISNVPVLRGAGGFPLPACGCPIPALAFRPSGLTRLHAKRFVSYPVGYQGTHGARTDIAVSRHCRPHFSRTFPIIALKGLGSARSRLVCSSPSCLGLALGSVSQAPEHSHRAAGLGWEPDNTKNIFEPRARISPYVVGKDMQGRPKFASFMPIYYPN